METKLRVVGNSVVTTIPQGVIEAAGLAPGDEVIFSVFGDVVQLKKKKKKLKGERYLEKLFGKPIEEIEKFDTEIVDTGTPLGEEFW